MGNKSRKMRNSSTDTYAQNENDEEPFEHVNVHDNNENPVQMLETLQRLIEMAIANKNMDEMVRLFKTHHFNPDAVLETSFEHFTPLTLVCLHNYRSIVEGLLEMGANIHGKDGWGRQPIHEAAYRESVNCIDELVYHVFMSKRDFQRKLVLNINAFRGRGEPFSMEVPINHFKHNIDVRDEDGRTALHRASRGGAIRAINYLINQGAEVDARDDDGRTPLYLAVYRGHTIAVFHLLHAGADLNAVDNAGRTPFDNAHSFLNTRRRKIKETIDLLEFVLVKAPVATNTFDVKKENVEQLIFDHAACKMNVNDSFRINDYVLNLLTTHFFKKLKNNTDDLAFFSRIKENEDYICEYIFDEDDEY